MKHIYISAGHSNSDPGASANGATEAQIVVEFRDMIAFYLEQALAPYNTDGVKGDNKPLNEAVKGFKREDVAVEVHLNAASPAASGVETLSAPDQYTFCNKICSVVADRLKIKNRGAKAESSGQHSKLAFVSAGGIILELFFLTNVSDLASYNEVKWLLAKDIAGLLIEEAS